MTRLEVLTNASLMLSSSGGINVYSDNIGSAVEKLEKKLEKEKAQMAETENALRYLKQFKD